MLVYLQRQLSVHRLNTLPTRRAFPPGVCLSNKKKIKPISVSGPTPPSVQPVYTLHCFQTTTCASLFPAGLPGPCKIKTNMTTCPQYAAIGPKSHMHGFSSPSVNQTEEGFDMFPLIQLQKRSGPTSVLEEHLDLS